MPYATNEETRIHYRVEGSGPPLILQHGLFWSLEGWERWGYVESLNRFQLILVDARGHGESGKPHDSIAYSLANHVADIVAVLDDLGIRSAHYWGFSMGGWIGFGLAVLAPERIEALVMAGLYGETDEQLTSKPSEAVLMAATGTENDLPATMKAESGCSSIG